MNKRTYITTSTLVHIRAPEFLYAYYLLVLAVKLPTHVPWRLRQSPPYTETVLAVLDAIQFGIGATLGPYKGLPNVAPGFPLWLALFNRVHAPVLSPRLNLSYTLSSKPGCGGREALISPHHPHA